LVRPRLARYLREVLEDLVGDPDIVDPLEHRCQLVRRDDLLHNLEVHLGEVPPYYRRLHTRRGVVELELHHEPVELPLGEGVDALELQRILRSDHPEWGWSLRLAPLTRACP